MYNRHCCYKKSEYEILEMGQCGKSVLIDGGRNAARLRYLDTCGEDGLLY